jgi:cellulose synthase/poly-beta-1,6-N-acetylglucosamine synthase-like glycosyltransferase
MISKCAFPKREGKMENEESKSRRELVVKGASVRVSLIVRVLDEAAKINELLVDIASQSRLPDEIVMVDSGSSDGTLELLRQASAGKSRLRVIEARRTSRGLGRNIGIANARYEWIALTDADSRLDPDWLERLSEVVASQPTISVVCGNVEPKIDSLFEECAAIAYLPSKSVRPGGSVRGPCTSSLLVHRETWKSVGGFPDMGAAEDLMFFEELRRKGFDIEWAPGAIVHSRLSPTIGGIFHRFVLHSSCIFWANPQRKPEVRVVSLLTLGTAILVLVALHSLWWLVVPVFALFARTMKNIWRYSSGMGIIWLLNPLRFIGVLVITLTIDLGTFVGWIKALLKPSEWRRISSMITTMRGE